ncbi:MAG: hypothetical protein HRU70_00860 [Phycisphaeraceae bacterium]|nr:MAG: hypothetical protein HRU70_00860 [Phycisphaeraceae bacterium]
MSRARSDMVRRFAYYFAGLAIGLVLLGMIQRGRGVRPESPPDAAAGAPSPGSPAGPSGGDR